MRYVLLIYSVDPTTWYSLPEEQREAHLPDHLAFDAELVRSGERLESASLADPARSMTVSRSTGDIVVTDGPFAESKEQLTGFYLLDCESEERAIEIASRTPDARFTRVELRPCMELDAGVEM